MNKKRKGGLGIRIISGLLIIFIGIALASMLLNAESKVGKVGENIGFAFIVTGFIFLFREAVVAWWEREELKKRLENIKEEIIGANESVTKKVKEGHAKIIDVIRKGTAMRVVASRRREYQYWHTWVFEKRRAQDLFFAGHSVLNRVKDDFDNKHTEFGKVEDGLVQQVLQGSRIRILFLDPDGDLLEGIAKAGGQDQQNIQSNLEISKDVCKDIFVKLKKKLQDGENLQGRIEIHTCQDPNQYSLHRVSRLDGTNCTMLVGLYFRDIDGIDSPLFRTEDPEVRKFFMRHFDYVFDKGKEIVAYLPPATLRFMGQKEA